MYLTTTMFNQRQVPVPAIAGRRARSIQRTLRSTGLGPSRARWIDRPALDRIAQEPPLLGQVSASLRLAHAQVAAHRAQGGVSQGDRGLNQERPPGVTSMLSRFAGKRGEPLLLRNPENIIPHRSIGAGRWAVSRPSESAWSADSGWSQAGRRSFEGLSLPEHLDRLDSGPVEPCRTARRDA